MRHFNTAGPCDPELHYTLDPVARLAEGRRLIDQRGYFVVHAPRQTGKTTSLRALARLLTGEGRYAALHVSCEAGQAAGDDYGAAERILLHELELNARRELDAPLHPPAPWPAAPAGALLRSGLEAWALSCPRPLVLFLDEIDALSGRSLESVLRQLRAGFPDRPRAFPASVVLCGLRDVRDYKTAAGGDPTRLGTASPFNVKVESLRLAAFTAEEVRALYGQHTADTGQPFEPDAVARAAELTGGQPWLVNALAREVIEKMGVAPPAPITVTHVDEAKERLMLARATHLDSLVARLTEPRVRRILEPLITGDPTDEPDLPPETYDDDFLYVRDLGLVAPDSPTRVANPIYREVIVRVLAVRVEREVTVEPRSFVAPDGRLDLRRLLEEFAAFWALHGEVLAGRIPYPEAAPHLVLMAYLQRVVNGGGYVDREYGVGRGRIDLLVRWPFDEGGRRAWQQEAVELKVWKDGRADPLPLGLEQLDHYLERLSLDHGTLVVFDRRRDRRPTAARTRLEQATTPSGRAVTVLCA